MFSLEATADEWDKDRFARRARRAPIFLPSWRHVRRRSCQDALETGLLLLRMPPLPVAIDNALVGLKGAQQMVLGAPD